MCPEAQFEEEFIYGLERNLAFPFASVHRVYFSAAWGKTILAVLLEMCFTCGWKDFAENYFLHEKKYVFFIIFGLRTIFRPLSQIFSGIVKTAFQVSKCISRIFFEKRFFVTLGHGAKRFGPFSKNFWQGCQNSFHVSTGTSWRTITFSGKSKFFFYHFRKLGQFLWRARHNCMLPVLLHSEEKYTFWKKNFITFGQWAVIFPAFGEKNSAGCHEGVLYFRKDDFMLKFVSKKSSFQSLSYIEKIIFAFWKKNWAKCHKINLRVHGNSLLQILFEKFLFFYRFRTFRDSIPAFCRSFSEPPSELLFSCRIEQFEEIVFWKKTVFSLLTKSKKLLAFCRRV